MYRNSANACNSRKIEQITAADGRVNQGHDPCLIIDLGRGYPLTCQIREVGGVSGVSLLLLPSPLPHS